MSVTSVASAEHPDPCDCRMNVKPYASIASELLHVLPVKKSHHCHRSEEVEYGVGQYAVLSLLLDCSCGPTQNCPIDALSDQPLVKEHVSQSDR